MGIIGLILVIAGISLFLVGFPYEILGALLLLSGIIVCVIALMMKKRTAYAIGGLVIVAMAIMSQLPPLFWNDATIPLEVLTTLEPPPPVAGQTVDTSPNP